MSTNYDIDDDYLGTIDEDLLLAGKDGYLSGGGGGFSGDVFWNLKANTTRTFYFLSDPWTLKVDHGWWIWREIYAEAGLAGGIQLPQGLRGIPVTDQETVPSPDGEGVRRRDIPAGSPKADQLLGLVVPYLPRNETRMTRPYRPVADKVGGNVLEVVRNADGTDSLYHKVLVFSGARYIKLKKEIRSKASMIEDGSFSLIGRPWELELKGMGAMESLDLRPLRDQPPVDMPELIDIPEKLKEKRQQIFDIVRTTAKVDTSRYEEEDAARYADEPAPADVPAPSEEQAAPEPSREELYESMTDARIKTLLTKAGVPVPPKTARKALIALAVDNNI